VPCTPVAPAAPVEPAGPGVLSFLHALTLIRHTIKIGKKSLFDFMLTNKLISYNFKFDIDCYRDLLRNSVQLVSIFAISKIFA
jgi:hypothetical protein